MYECVYVYLLCLYFCSFLYIYFNFREARKERWSAHDTTIAHLDLIVCVVFRRSVRLRSLLRSVCVRARSCVCICRAVFILDRVKWIDPVNPSMTLPIFILKSTVWRINKSDRKKTHILKRNRTQKKNCKYWRERKKNAEERRKDYRTRLNFVNSNIKFKAFRKIHKSRAQPNEIAKTHNNRSQLKQQQHEQ